MSVQDTVTTALRAWAKRFQDDLDERTPEMMVAAFRAEVLREAVQQIRDEADSVDIPGSSFTPSVVHGMKLAADLIDPEVTE